MEQKSLRLTTFLAILVMGVGHIYVGQTKRGVYLLVLGIVLTVAFSSSNGVGEFYASESRSLGTGLMYILFALVISIVLFVTWIWQIFNARKTCNQHNAQQNN